MIYRLGNIQFERLETPLSFSRESTINFVERERIAGKPLLQKLGGVLDTLSLEIRFHYSFCNVRDSVNQIRDAAEAAQSLILINGAGYKEGEFVITSYRTDHEKVDNQGRLLHATMSIQLKEFVTADLETDEAMAARKKGFANISVNPIQTNPTVRYQNPQSLTIRNISVTEAAGRTAAINVRKAAAVPDLAKKYMAIAKRGLERTQKISQMAKNGVDDVVGKITNAQQLKDSLELITTTTTEMLSNYTEPNLPAIHALSITLDQNLTSMRTAAVQLSNVTALRK